MKQKTLYFTQKITTEVLDYVRETPTCTNCRGLWFKRGIVVSRTFPEKVRGFAGKYSVYLFASADFFFQPLCSWNRLMQYTPYISVLVVTTLLLGLVLCYVMQRKDA